MGVFDRVILEEGEARLGILPGESFQTKSLEPILCRYVIRQDGRLMLSGGSALIPYHGDILLFRETSVEPREFVARFTEGQLQWIRKMDSYPANLAGLLGRGP